MKVRINERGPFAVATFSRDVDRGLHQRMKP